ncbi:hypothetical protein CANCADRAFT_2837 [Tortispora caseinolytica NRRL Y-17796]|uniref:Checkpoint protein RAD24-like helical bundle domain-containing protein n=1 Tax=Tortispora caseinolytica NRRL Y-17796 TaxID=767744 RepID=A0A1E4TH96_9ASCO|nr:hypothetical protein CANCADRAFT_2837 [Tortispora caseinolytica NRRL Y-17796]
MSPRKRARSTAAQSAAQPSVLSLLKKSSLSFPGTKKIKTAATSTPVDNLPEELIDDPISDDDDGSVGGIKQLIARNEMESDLWVQKYAPSVSSDLAVHSRKLKDTKEAFDLLLSGRINLLVLSGPSGVCKTATLKTLAKEQGREIIEWTEDAISFTDWCRSTRQSSLQIGIATTADFSSSTYASFSKPSKFPIKLVEDLPLSAYSNLESERMSRFQAPIIEHLEGKYPGPMVIIITEIEGESDRFNSVNSERILGARILNHKLCRLIKFNKVAKTIATKALRRILTLEKWSTKKIKDANDIISGLSAIGDVRNAVNGLQFYAISPKVFSELFAEGIMEGRESYFGLFHSVGKIAYYKPDEYSDGKMLDVDYVMQALSPWLFEDIVFENYAITNPPIDSLALMAESASASDIMKKPGSTEVLCLGTAAGIEMCKDTRSERQNINANGYADTHLYYTRSGKMRKLYNKNKRSIQMKRLESVQMMRLGFEELNLGYPQNRRFKPMLAGSANNILEDIEESQEVVDIEDNDSDRHEIIMWKSEKLMLSDDEISESE